MTSLSIIFILVSMVNNSDKFTNTETIEEKTTIQINENTTPKLKQIIEQNITVAKVETQKIIPKEQASDDKMLILSPSLNFMSNIKHSSISYDDNDEVRTPSVNIKPKNKSTQKVIAPKEKLEQIEVKAIEKKNVVHIERQNTQEDISHVIKRFKKNNNPALSLFVAKKYYEIEEYHKSYNYALITNEINDNIEASWIIFSKSLVKLNEKDEAIKTLKKYIEHSHSSQAKILLDEITSGKFK
ncbi:CDC27 family protein [Sulfurimonas gotlandica]|nr:CDC27 family protein [Sulfurimonas gotlandica]